MIRPHQPSYPPVTGMLKHLVLPTGLCYVAVITALDAACIFHTTLFQQRFDCIRVICTHTTIYKQMGLSVV